MPEFLSGLGTIAAENQFLVYLFVYTATIFFGNISAFVSFWLAMSGALGEWGVPLTLLALLLSVLSGDCLWYTIGKKLHDTKTGFFMRNRFAPHHEKIAGALAKNGPSWIFASKFLYASSFPIIFTAGWVNFPAKNFFRTSLFSVAIWLPIFSGVAFGLFAGLTPLQAIAVLKKFEISLLVGLGLFFIAEYFLAKIAKKVFAGVFKNGINNASEEANDKIDTASGSHKICRRARHR